MSKHQEPFAKVSRRLFIKTSAAAATTLGALTAGIGPVFSAGVHSWRDEVDLICIDP